jgi:hypothetical protein
MTTDITANIQEFRQRLHKLVAGRDKLDKQILHARAVLKNFVEMAGVKPELKKSILQEIKEADWKKPSLRTAIEHVLNNSAMALTAKEVKERLVAAALFEPSDYAQAQSSVGNTLNRMWKDKRVRRAVRDGQSFYHQRLIPLRPVKKD